MGAMKRPFAVLFVLLLAATLSFAGAKQEGDKEPPPRAEAEKPAPAAEVMKEAPELAEMVKAGTLRPLEERLPEEPLVLEPVDELGRYGGTVRKAHISPTDGAAFTRLSAEGMMRFSVDGQRNLPNIAKSWEISPDGRVYTLFLREGMKWSDGEPFTADDVMFWYNDIALNVDLSPSPPKTIMSGGEPGKFEKVNDYTVRITFAKPYAFFLHILTTPSISTNGLYPYAPAHYLKQFHPAYTNKETIDKMVKDQGLDTWTVLFSNKASDWLNPERPVVFAWKLTNEPGESRLIAERNPFYWKIDPEGKQLPYVDRIVLDQVENPELILLKASNGELDMQFRHIKFEDYTLLKENQSKGNYTVFTHGGDRAARVCFWPNMAHEDPVYHELMNSTEFKRALSLAIDRDELNELFYFGLGTPRGVTAISSEPTYEADVAQMNAKYDVDEANRILDKLGFDKRDNKGIRLGPDGKPIFFLIPYATSWPYMGDEGQVVLDYWKKIGIDGLIKPMERSVFYQMSYNNELPLTLFTSPGTSLGNSWWVFPSGAHNSYGYGKWYSSEGKEGIEPPAGSKVRQAQELYRQAMESAKFEDVIDALKQILRWANEEIWGIGLVGEIPAIGVVSNNLYNVPKNAPSGTHLGHPGNLYAEQWFFK